MTRTSHNRTIGHRRNQSGFSLIEVLMAMVLLVVVVAGLLPLFSRSVIQNVEGREATQSTNLGLSQTEDRRQLAFNNFQMDLTAGTQLQVMDYWDQGNPNKLGDEQWVTTAPTTTIAPWNRTTTIQQFGIGRPTDADLDGIADTIPGLEDTDLDGVFDNPLAFGSPPESIHMKLIDVQIQAQKTWALGGAATATTLRSMKSF